MYFFYSGVATSLSCTDSSTASSDASDPGSPYSPASLGDDIQHQLSKKSNQIINTTIMPPSQTINTTTKTSTNTNVASSAGGGISGGPAAINPKQLQLQQIIDQQNNLWPWNSLQNNTTATVLPIVAPITPITAATTSCTTSIPAPPLTGITINNPIQQNTITSANQIINGNKLTNTARNHNNKNKRLSSATNNHLINSQNSDNHITANKKSRLNNLITQSASVVALPAPSLSIVGGGGSLNGAANPTDFVKTKNKRLKLANTNEECQTKITGFFKSQMKQLKKDKNLMKNTTNNPAIHLLNDLDNFYNNHNNDNDEMPNFLTTTTTANKTIQANTATVTPTNFRNYDTNKILNDRQSLVPLINQSGPQLNLKKNERNKNTKIAQVAPNVRKTTNSMLPISTTFWHSVQVCWFPSPAMAPAP